MSDDEQLIEYQTEQDQEDQDGTAAVPVEVCGPVVTVPTVPHHATSHTLIADTDTGNQQVVEVLPLDPLRVRATVHVHDQPVVICHSRAQARAAANAQTAGAGAWPLGGGYDSGVQVAPTAGTEIAGLTAAALPAGWYSVRIYAGFGANPEAATDFNIAVKVGADSLAANLMVTAAANNIRSWVFDRVYCDGSSALSVQAAANASASSVYVADVLATLLEPLTPARPDGVLLLPGESLVVTSTAQRWVVPLSAMPARVSVDIERRAA